MSEKHGCRWVGCSRMVPLNMWSCRQHWYRLPAKIRNGIWASYRPGQEDDLNPSPGWIEADEAARRYSEQNP